METPITPAAMRKLRGLAQRMDATLKVGKAGLTPAFIHSLQLELDRHELVKVRFADLKDQRKELAPQLAEKSGATLVTLVGNVAVLFRRNPDPEKQTIDL